jgi:putative endonuclease
MKDQSYIYIITNKHNKILYIGVTSDLVKRIYQHKNKLVDGFSKKYSLYKLVYYEISESIISSIEREKFLKKKTRDYKINLIDNFNPDWKDLYTDII